MNRGAPSNRIPFTLNRAAIVAFCRAPEICQQAPVASRERRSGPIRVGGLIMNYTRKGKARSVPPSHVFIGILRRNQRIAKRLRSQTGSDLLQAIDRPPENGIIPGETEFRTPFPNPASGWRMPHVA